MSSILILRCCIDQICTHYGHLNANEDTVTNNDLDSWTFPSSFDSNITFSSTGTLPTNSPPAQPQPVCCISQVHRAVDRFGPYAS